VRDDSMTDLARRMRLAAGRVLDSLHPDQRCAATAPFDLIAHRLWTFFPGERPGARLGDLDDDQLGLALDLLASVHSQRALADAHLVIRIESVRRELSGRAGDAYRSLNYWLLITCDPGGSEPWAWRISGHHLLAQATVVGDMVAGAPHFFGSEPAEVLSGPHRGFRALPREEDLGRELALSLQEDQRSVGLLAPVAPAEIRTRFDPVATVPTGPAGFAYARLDRFQRELLDALLRQYLDRATAAVANQAWADLNNAGLDAIRFGWAGPLQRGAGHYYRVSGPSLLIEYDNTQDDANHIHSVWRDLRSDFGGDLLARHYAASHP